MIKTNPTQSTTPPAQQPTSQPQGQGAPLASQAPQAPQARPLEPLCNLLAGCVECGQGIELPLPIDQRGLSYMLAQVGWFISVLAPPTADPSARMVIGPLCTPCAQKVYPPDVYAAADQRRRQLLQSLPPPNTSQPSGAQPPSPTPPLGAIR